MARFRPLRINPVSTAFLLWGIWRRVPRQQRRWMLAQARRHGPRVVRQVVVAARKR